MGRLPEAVVVGYENNGMGVSRALARCGIPCIAVAAPHWLPTWTSRTARIVAAREWSEDGVIDRLLAIGQGLSEKAPLLLTRDDSVLWISQHREKLAPYYLINLPPAETVADLMNKQAFTTTAMARGWPVPKYWNVASEQELVACIPQIAFPCILKPAVKNNAFRRHSNQKAFKASNGDQLIAHYRGFVQWESDAIVQEWIEGGDERVAFVLGYWNAAAEPLAMFAGRKLRQWPPEWGNTAMAAPAPNEWRTQLIELTGRIFEAFRFRGLGSLEYKVDRNGSLIITEPTVGRTNYQSEVAVLNGTNLPAIAYFDILGRSAEAAALVPSADATHPAVKLVDGRADYRAARHYMRAGKLTFGQWLESRKGAKRYFVLRASDPMPFVASIALRCYSFARGLLSQVRHKLSRRKP